MSREAWIHQFIGAAISVPWLGCYAWAFVRGWTKVDRWTDVLYNLGFLLNLSWLAMALLPQPRLPGLLALDRLSIVSAGPVLLGAVVFLAYAGANVRVMASNSAAVMRRYARPERLLQTEAYGDVRHPMNMGGGLAFFGLCLALGSAYTLALLPLYAALNHGFTVFEERLGLRRAFGAAYQAYATRVPAYFNLRNTLVLGLLVFGTTLQWTFFPPRA